MPGSTEHGILRTPAAALPGPTAGVSLSLQSGILHQIPRVTCTRTRHSQLPETGRQHADVLPDPKAGLLRVRVHGMPNGRSNTAVSELCRRLNEAQVKYPGTQLTLRYESLVDA